MSYIDFNATNVLYGPPIDRDAHSPCLDCPHAQDCAQSEMSECPSDTDLQTDYPLTDDETPWNDDIPF